jgi:8-oxo-dGTP pyrophosphatase MutT (NUDIX family)
VTSLRADARSVLAGWAPPTPRDAALRDRFVAHLDARDDGMTRECLPDHLTAGTIVLTPEADAVLLNHHRKADGWFAFGGHCEPRDATLAGVALREAREESGLADLDFDPEPLDLDEHAVQFCAPGVTVHHLDVRFLATAPRDAGHRVSEESLDVRWWPADRLPDVYDDMRRLIAVAVARLERRRAQSTSSAPSAPSSVSLDGGSTLAAADQPSR